VFYVCWLTQLGVKIAVLLARPDLYTEMNEAYFPRRQAGSDMARFNR
jgi:hypothetical protein